MMAPQGLAHDGVVGRLDDGGQMRASLLSQPLMTDVAYEPAAVNQSARIPLSIGGNPHVAH